MHDHEVAIDVGLVRRLVDAQFPEYAELALSIVEPWGTDNAIWRLGERLVVRLPRIESATNQVGFEHEWLPRLASALTVAIPEPVAVGEPGFGYPFPWAVHRWLPGSVARVEAMADPERFALAVARVVRELGATPTAGAPEAKNRARPLEAYDGATREMIRRCAGLIDVDQALAVWEDALAAEPHRGPAVWVHGDLEGNCLVDDGELSGLLDWGLGCAGDPAVDVQVVWSPLFTESSRAVFLDALAVDDATLARSRGAAINQACGALPYYLDTYPLIVERSWHKLDALGVTTYR